MKLRRRIVPFEVKAAGSASGSMSFEGYGGCTRNIDGYGEIIAPGAFLKDLPKFLDDGFIGGLNHDWDRPIGKPVAAVEDSRGLFLKAALIPELEHARECHTLLKNRVCKKLSIGFKALEKGYLDDQDDVLAWWKEVGYEPSEDEIAEASHGAVILKRVRLYEVSPVMIPANQQADITDVKRSMSGKAAGLTFDSHLVEALALVGEVCDRAEAIGTKRTNHGRNLTAERRAVLKQMQGRLAKALERTEPLVSQAERLRLQVELELLDLELPTVFRR
jgi:HK97 family phage prohead protease